MIAARHRRPFPKPRTRPATRWISALVTDPHPPAQDQIVHTRSDTLTAPVPFGRPRVEWIVSAHPWERHDGPLLRGWLGAADVGNGATLYMNTHGLAVVRTRPVWDTADRPFVWVMPLPDNPELWDRFVAHTRP